VTFFAQPGKVAHLLHGGVGVQAAIEWLAEGYRRARKSK
jgi:hypothetical protein